jgi:hypothetical protein
MPQHTSTGAARLVLLCAGSGDVSGCAHELAPPTQPALATSHALALAWALCVLFALGGVSLAARRAPGGAADCFLHVAPFAVVLERAPLALHPLARAPLAELLLGASLAATGAGILAAATSAAGGAPGPGLGALNAFLLGLSLLPVTRHSLWLPLARIPVAPALRLHAAATRALLPCVIAHAATLAAARARAAAGDASTTPRAAAAALLASFQPTRGGAGAAYGTAAGACLAAMALSPLLRRASWPLFKLIHLTLFPPAVILAIIHARLVFPYAMPGLALWAADRILRMRSGNGGSGSDAAEVRVLALRALPCGATLIELDNSARKMALAPCQHIQLRFLRTPALGSAETHPYSVAGAPGVPGVIVLLVASGRVGKRPGALAPRLHAHARALARGGESGGAAAAPAGDDAAGDDDAVVSASLPCDSGGGALAVCIEGPYGVLSLRCPRRYKAIVLLCGGSGVSAMVSLAAHLLSAEEEEAAHAAADAAAQTEAGVVQDAVAASAADVEPHDAPAEPPCAPQRTRVTFVWAAREAAALRQWAPGLLAAMAAHPRCEVRLFCTGSNPESSSAANGDAEEGREMDDVAAAASDAASTPLPRIEAGRPDVDALVAAAGGGHAARDVGVAVCGPARLVAAAHAAARRRRFHFHAEAFEV